jgi:ribosomal protein L15E
MRRLGYGAVHGYVFAFNRLRRKMERPDGVRKPSKQPVSALILSMQAKRAAVRGPLDRQRETFSRLRFGGYGLAPAELKGDVRTRPHAD